MFDTSVLADRTQQTTFELRGVPFLPHYRKPGVYVAPGRHAVVERTWEDLTSAGANRVDMFLWERNSNG